MNLIKKLIVVAGCCAVALGACKKEKIYPDNFISYKVDGVLKTFKATAYYYPDGTVSVDDGAITGPGLTLYMSEHIKIGTVKFEDTTGVVFSIYDDGISRGGFLSDSGILRITSINDNHIGGTFEFTCRNNPLGGNVIIKNITNGKFEADLQDGYVPIDDSLYHMARSQILKRHLK